MNKSHHDFTYGNRNHCTVAVRDEIKKRLVYILRQLSHEATRQRQGRDNCCIRDALLTTAMLFNRAVPTKRLQRVCSAASNAHDDKRTAMAASSRQAAVTPTATGENE